MGQTTAAWEKREVNETIDRRGKKNWGLVNDT